MWREDAPLTKHLHAQISQAKLRARFCCLFLESGEHGDFAAASPGLCAGALGPACTAQPKTMTGKTDRERLGVFWTDVGYIGKRSGVPSRYHVSPVRGAACAPRGHGPAVRCLHVPVALSWLSHFKTKPRGCKALRGAGTSS